MYLYGVMPQSSVRRPGHDGRGFPDHWRFSQVGIEWMSVFALGLARLPRRFPRKTGSTCRVSLARNPATSIPHDKLFYRRERAATCKGVL